MTSAGRPLRFLAMALGLWVGGRVLILAPWRAAASAEGGAGMTAAPARADRPAVAAGWRQPLPAPLSIAPNASPAALRQRPEPGYAGSPTGPRPAPGNGMMQASLSGSNVPDPSQAALSPTAADAAVPAPRPGPTFAGQAVTLAAADTTSRWRGSAWLFVRRGGGSLLAPGGQLAGSQAGGRVTWRAADGFALAARVSRPLRVRGLEAAAGVEWRPLAGVPIRLAAERRVALDAYGRDAFTLYAFGGVDAVPLGPLRLDAYGQAGIVGAHAHDLFADGAVRIGRALPVSGRTSLTLGGGAWGGAQPGVARLDLGPQAVLRFPAGPTGMALALDWRLRVAGQAAPGSGPTLTLGVDF